MLAAAADRGFVAAPGTNSLSIVVHNESATITLKELVKRVPHVPSPEEVDREVRRQKAAQANKWDLYSRLYEPGPRWDYNRTGSLVLEVENGEYLRIRTRWSDTATRKVEGCLNEILAGLTAFAAAKKQQREERERWQREYKAQQRSAEEARERALLEKARIEFLHQRLEAFGEMTKLQKYLEHLTSTLCRTESPSNLALFLQWAEMRVQKLRLECGSVSLSELLANAAIFDGGVADP